MSVYKRGLFIILLIGLFLVLFSCQQQEADKQEITQEELSAAVPELSNLHSVVYPLWHDAYPAKDYELMQQLLPEMDSLTIALDNAELPGILRDKKEAWQAGKMQLKNSLQQLHKAADADNKDEMQNQAEEFHANFEKLVRIIRPVTPELAAFHQEMYKLYHYFMPNYELEKIRETVSAMEQKLPPLKQAQLPSRLADRQEKYDSAVQELEAAVAQLSGIVTGNDKKAIEAAVEEVHTAYQGVEVVFD